MSFRDKVGRTSWSATQTQNWSPLRRPLAWLWRRVYMPWGLFRRLVSAVIPRSDMPT